MCRVNGLFPGLLPRAVDAFVSRYSCASSLGFPFPLRAVVLVVVLVLVCRRRQPTYKREQEQEPCTRVHQPAEGVKNGLGERFHADTSHVSPPPRSDLRNSVHCVQADRPGWYPAPWTRLSRPIARRSSRTLGLGFQGRSPGVVAGPLDSDRTWRPIGRDSTRPL